MGYADPNESDHRDRDAMAGSAVPVSRILEIATQMGKLGPLAGWLPARPRVDSLREFESRMKYVSAAT